MRPRASFRRWRRTRPFWGGLCIVASAVWIFLTVKAPLPVVVHVGLQGLAGFLVPVIMLLCGVLLWFSPENRTFYSILALVMALASWVTSNLGGFLVGLLLGVVGGSLAFSWQPGPPRPAPTPPPDAPAGSPDARTGWPAGPDPAAWPAGPEPAESPDARAAWPAGRELAQSPDAVAESPDAVAESPAGPEPERAGAGSRADGPASGRTDGWRDGWRDGGGTTTADQVAVREEPAGP